ncbi:MAG: hypothetical protein ACD_3C00212G0001 [uncultured bacterium (gcode 4)]|uniref:Uncharacterized protein n=1 Tax=uncultured bacterium (gcode 4) TaxID=1234023 RepID=K2FZQ7_9BACT|nr:MAG: hypothetical protein ACD_3C00212G0001 [uncultured bacterium (gcode 4)]
MAYKFSSLKAILDIFSDDSLLWVTEIATKLNKSNVIVHKYIKELVKQGKIIKIWVGPMVKYSLNRKGLKSVNIIENNQETITANFNYSDKKLLDEIFLKFSPDWRILKGYEWFIYWCKEKNMDPTLKFNSLANIYWHIQKIQDDCGVIDASKAFWKDFEKIYIDNIYYADQYNWIEFGRGKLAEMSFYWKQSQNKTLINECINEIFYKLECLINRWWYDAIAIIPWSIDRKNQFLWMLKNRLKILNTPFVNIIKYYPNSIAIPQKSLKTREQRIQNARNTIFADDDNLDNYKKILLIDDFVGSWSTINETAKKLKEWLDKKVDAFAFVWNLNLSYDVINEM